MRFWFDVAAVHSWLPEGTSGVWSVKRRVVEGSRAEWLRLGGDLNGDYSPPGIYTELYFQKRVQMSDDLQLINAAQKFAEKATGNVLLTGLGLGMVAQWIAAKESVKSVDVIELSTDVIRLVSQHLNPKVKVFHDDAYTYRPRREYDCAWHDCFTEEPTRIDELLNHYRPYVAIQNYYKGIFLWPSQAPFKK